MNVMAGSGLVGIITDVGPNYAKVKAIISDTSSVSGMVLTTSDNIIVNGSLQKMTDSMSIEFNGLNDRENKVQVGDPVVTSYVSYDYQQGILIGYIQDIEVDSSNMTKNATLIPAVDFERLDEVLIITELKEAYDFD